MTIELDPAERRAFRRFVRFLENEQAAQELALVVDEQMARRGTDGQIVVPVTIQADRPSVHLAILMGHKAEQLYKQRACRFLLAQRPERDPNRPTYVWVNGGWKTLA